MRQAVESSTSAELDDLLSSLTVLVFTRDRHQAVHRLLSFLARTSCYVNVFDNGVEPLPEGLLPASGRITYTYTPGHWSLNWLKAAESIGTEFACFVDDDGLLAPRGAASAIRSLRDAPDAVAAEGATGDFVIVGCTALFHWIPAKGGRSVNLHSDAHERVSNVFREFSYGPWYAIHRSAALSRGLRVAAEVEAESSSRNVSTPILIALMAAQGRILTSNHLVSIREVSGAPHEPAAMDLWIGDWMGDPKYASEVRRVEERLAGALVTMNASDESSVLGIISDFRDFGASIAHLASKSKHPILRRIWQYTLRLARPARHIASSSSSALTSEHGSAHHSSTQYSWVFRSKELAGLECMPMTTFGPYGWYAVDLQEVIDALEVQTAATVIRPLQLKQAVAFGEVPDIG